MDITNLDITTGAGVSVVAVFLIELLKKSYLVTGIKIKPWYSSFINLATLLIAFALSTIAMIVFNTELKEMLLNGLIGFLLAIGGYEPLVNIFRGFIKKK